MYGGLRRSKPVKLDPRLLLLGLFVFGGKRPAGGSSAPTLRIPKNGAHLNLDELRTLAAQVGFPDPNLAAAVAMAESGGYVEAVGDVDKGKSVGLWQINLPSHPTYDARRLTEATYNATAALEISKRGADWTPWTAYNSGAYKQYLPPSTAGELPPPAPRADAPPPPPRESEPAVMRDVAPSPLDDEHLNGHGPVDVARTPDAEAALDQVEQGEESADEGARLRVAEDEPKTGRARRARRG